MYIVNAAPAAPAASTNGVFWVQEVSIFLNNIFNLKGNCALFFKRDGHTYTHTRLGLIKTSLGNTGN